MSDLQLNERAMGVCDVLADQSNELGVVVHTIAHARIIDAGAKVVGSLEAGCLTARACMADLGVVQIVPMEVEGIILPAVCVHVHRPVEACMASQYAGWQISEGKFFAMGSGPMRAARGKEALFDDIGFRETPRCVVGVLETGRLPDDAVVQKIARSCGVPADRITLVVARTASLAGGVQVVARSVETAMHKLHELKFDLECVVGGFGVAPVPPVAQDDMAAIGRTNDAMLYGARCTLFVRGDDDEIAKVGEQLPSCASKDYGAPFAEIFKQYDHDFYKIDPMLFSPAAVCLQNITSGKSHIVGKISQPILARSFFGVARASRP